MSPFPSSRLSVSSQSLGKVRHPIDHNSIALKLVEMQNHFLSPHIGHPSNAVGLKAVESLFQYAIPACRRAGIPAVYLNWGLTEQDVEVISPTIVKDFAADVNSASICYCWLKFTEQRRM